MTQEQFISWLNRRKSRYGTWRKFAEATGIPLSGLCDTANGKRKPPTALLLKLGVTATVNYSVRKS